APAGAATARWRRLRLQRFRLCECFFFAHLAGAECGWAAEPAGGAASTIVQRMATAAAALDRMPCSLGPDRLRRENDHAEGRNEPQAEDHEHRDHPVRTPESHDSRLIIIE